MEVKYSYGNKSGLPANITNGQVYVCKDDGTMYADLENKRYQIGGSYKGYFPELKVGYSDNMNGRREESSAEFIYRPSNDATIKNLVIKDYSINFKSDVYDYKLKIGSETSLEI